eukprot:1394700-Amorphochlora_amoeboformis.AAC.1
MITNPYPSRPVSNTKTGSLRVDVVGTRTLLDINKRPFSAFEVEVKTVNGTTHVLKRVEEFLTLNEDLTARNYQVPMMPRERAQGKYSNFMKDMHACLQAWLKLLTAEPAIAESDQFKQFLSTSATGTDPEELFPLSSSAHGDSKVLKTSIHLAGSNTSRKTGGMEEKGGVNESKKKVGLEDFALLKVIGKGSFGKVMLVKKVDTKKVYAMKVEHTRTERNVLEYIRHPFIVTLRYAFQTKQKLYFVLDYCPGGELFFHLGRAGKFPESRAKFYAAQVHRLSRAWVIHVTL